ncbi:hypothetical protein [Brucella grignonensis]|uniref:hypothetical protein n=1 Tax=Brucella grignonensis TaxID=94627 RepID=UPI00142E90D5|nr:hypothetical protein [Brucella grignonensis]NKB83421.1 hypothetical protein [Brucella grignonensis]
MNAIGRKEGFKRRFEKADAKGQSMIKLLRLSLACQGAENGWRRNILKPQTGADKHCGSPTLVSQANISREKSSSS